MLRNSYRQISLTVLTWILVIFVLCGGGAGIGTAFADAKYGITAESGMGIFKVSDESYLREDDKNDSELDEGEYRSFYVNIRNNTPEDQREARVWYQVDGEGERPFSDKVRREDSTTQYHINPQDMDALDYGLHEIRVFVDEEPVCTQRLYVKRDWDEIMKSPTTEQIKSVSDTGRSTYVFFLSEI